MTDDYDKVSTDAKNASDQAAEKEYVEWINCVLSDNGYAPVNELDDIIGNSVLFLAFVKLTASLYVTKQMEKYQESSAKSTKKNQSSKNKNSSSKKSTSNSTSPEPLAKTTDAKNRLIRISNFNAAIQFLKNNMFSLHASVACKTNEMPTITSEDFMNNNRPAILSLLWLMKKILSDEDRPNISIKTTSSLTPDSPGFRHSPIPESSSSSSSYYSSSSLKDPHSRPSLSRNRSGSWSSYSSSTSAAAAAASPSSYSSSSSLSSSNVTKLNRRQQSKSAKSSTAPSSASSWRDGTKTSSLRSPEKTSSASSLTRRNIHNHNNHNNESFNLKHEDDPHLSLSSSSSSSSSSSYLRESNESLEEYKIRKADYRVSLAPRIDCEIDGLQTELERHRRMTIAESAMQRKSQRKTLTFKKQNLSNEAIQEKMMKRVNPLRISLSIDTKGFLDVNAPSYARKLRKKQLQNQCCFANDMFEESSNSQRRVNRSSKTSSAHDASEHEDTGQDRDESEPEESDDSEDDLDLDLEHLSKLFQKEMVLLTSALCSSPLRRLPEPELDVLWKYRSLLVRERRAFVPLLRGVQWDQREHVSEAKRFVWQWMDVLGLEEALDMLRSKQTIVREWAVKVLEREPLKRIKYVLLQLVQSLRKDIDDPIQSPLAKFLFKKSIQDFEVATRLNWYLTVEEGHDRRYANMFRKIHYNYYAFLKQSTQTAQDYLDIIVRQQKLVDALDRICEACKQSSCSRSKKTEEVKEILEFADVKKMNSNENNQNHNNNYNNGNKNNSNHNNENKNNENTHKTDNHKNDNNNNNNDNHTRFKERMNENQSNDNNSNNNNYNNNNSNNTIDPITYLKESGKCNLSSLFKGKFSNGLRLPINTDFPVYGIDSSKFIIFKSAMQPFGVFFQKKRPDETYRVIFKSGDDLRQDQLIVELFALFDNILNNEGCDLRFTHYRVVATSCENGFVEMVPNATNLAAVVEHGGVLAYLRRHHPGDDPKYLEVEPSVLTNYIYSCAAYCVSTYLLGVGDRHLDNLLMKESGHLFHIDFGFILGKDPKPMPPLMKLTREMIDGMGGEHSEHFSTFKILCCKAFHILRRHSNLIINCFLMMCEAIPEIDISLIKNGLERKFMLGLSDFEATNQMLEIIQLSPKAIVPQVTDTLHNWSQKMKN